MSIFKVEGVKSRPFSLSDGDWAKLHCRRPGNKRSLHSNDMQGVCPEINQSSVHISRRKCPKKFSIFHSFHSYCTTTPLVACLSFFHALFHIQKSHLMLSCLHTNITQQTFILGACWRWAQTLLSWRLHCFVCGLQPSLSLSVQWVLHITPLLRPFS